MEAFGFTGMTFGLIGFFLAAAALSKIDKLEKKLKDVGVLDKEFKSE